MNTRATVSMLVIYAAVYFVPLGWSPSLQHTLFSIALAIVVFGLATISICRGGHRGISRPSKLAMTFVGLSSGLEMVAVIVALFAGFVFEAWWLMAPLILTSVLLHFLSLTNAFRRNIDYLILPMTTFATVIVWAADRSDPLPAWGVAGGLVAGACLGYALGLWRSGIDSQTVQSVDDQMAQTP